MKMVAPPTRIRRRLVRRLTLRTVRRRERRILPPRPADGPGLGPGLGPAALRGMIYLQFKFTADILGAALLSSKVERRASLICLG
jgi:hypothetical protein